MVVLVSYFSQCGFDSSELIFDGTSLSYSGLDSPGGLTGGFSCGIRVVLGWY